MSTQFPERLAYLGRSLDEFNQHSAILSADSAPAGRSSESLLWSEALPYE